MKICRNEINISDKEYFVINSLFFEEFFLPKTKNRKDQKSPQLPTI
jgi:hypothetical protein